MEYRYACYLEWLRKNGDILQWLYEPEIFTWTNSRGTRIKYKPDFKVLEFIGKSPCGLIEARRHWVEVKGYMDSRSKAKIKGFERWYPEEKLILVDSMWFKRNTRKLKGLVPEWI